MFTSESEKQKQWKITEEQEKISICSLVLSQIGYGYFSGIIEKIHATSHLNKACLVLDEKLRDFVCQLQKKRKKEEEEEPLRRNDVIKTKKL